MDNTKHVTFTVNYIWKQLWENEKEIKGQRSPYLSPRYALKLSAIEQLSKISKDAIDMHWKTKLVNLKENPNTSKIW